ncbi:MAG: glycerophosphodiester phosphodiesterase [Gaiellaceae bacterium]
MTLVLAHRGACWDAPENTLAAFELAVEQGADYVEFDVRTMGNGALVVSREPISGGPPPGAPTLDATLEALRGRVGLAAGEGRGGDERGCWRRSGRTGSPRRTSSSSPSGSATSGTRSARAPTYATSSTSAAVPTRPPRRASGASASRIARPARAGSPSPGASA